MADTRRDTRAPVSLKVRFKSATVDEFIEHYARNISRGGIFIKSKSPMAVGTLLKFEFQLKDESRIIRGVGRVVWKREIEDSDEESAPGMGIKFIKMDPESRGLVESIVARRGGDEGQFEAGKDPRERIIKKTEPFFPGAPDPASLPLPEDSTQIRHASEFLASALLGAGVDEAAAAEATAKAEEARRRTEEIQKEREEQAARRKAAVSASESSSVEELPADTEVTAEKAAVAPDGADEAWDSTASRISESAIVTVDERQKPSMT